MNLAKHTILLGICCFIFLLHPSCRNRDPDFNKAGVRTKIEPIWKRSLHKEGTFYSNSSIKENLVYNGNPILATTEGEEDGERFINLIDIETGEDIWKWNDIFSGFSGIIDISYTYIHDNFMWYQYGSRSYTINLDDGSTQRKERFSNSFDRELSGLDRLVFLRGPAIDSLEEYDSYVGYLGDLEHGNIKQFLLPNLSLDYIAPGNLIGGFNDLTPIISNSDTFLIAIYTEPLPNWYIDSYLGLYNLSNKEWVYDRISLATPTQSSALHHPPVVYNDKIYMNLSNHIVCYDLFTGEQIWDESFLGGFLFSGFIVQEGKVIANCENSILYGLDADTGIELWQGEGAGTSSRLRYANGIVYFSGGSTGKIHAVDIENGKSVWRIDASSVEADAELFKPDIYISDKGNGEKPKIVFCTYWNAYCVEAYR